MKKVICILSIIAMLLGTAACAAPGGDVPDTTMFTYSDETIEHPPVETKAFDTIEPADYGGYTFRILYPQADNCYTDFYTVEQNGELLNDYIYNRNFKVKETLGINLEVAWMSYSDVNNKIRTLVTSGSYDYDMYGGHRSSLVLGYGGQLFDFYQMEEIDLDKEWWDQGWIDAISINNSIYALVGDISISCLLFISSLTFNKNLFDTLGIEYPYELVRRNKWTYDALIELLANYGEDTNNDGKMEWENDNFSITGWGTESGYSLFYASGFSFVSKTPDDSMSLDFNNERLVQIVDKVFKAWGSTTAYFNNSGTASQHSYPFTIFKEDRALFCDIVLSKIGTFLIDMSSDYGILPEPMFDENQERYYSYTGYTIPITMVPANCPDPERTGKIIEAFCTASYDDVTLDMYEIVTKVRNVRDSESSEMIQLIIRTKHFDPAHWYDIAGYGSFTRTIIANGTNNAATLSKTYNNAAKKALETIVKEYAKLKQ